MGGNIYIDGSGGLRGPSTFYIDPYTHGLGDISGLVIIRGNLQVDGVQTTINSTTININDKTLSLGSNATHISQLDKAGIEISDNTFLFRSDGGNNNRWESNISLTVSGDLKVGETNILGEINALKHDFSNLDIDASFVTDVSFDALVLRIDSSFVEIVADISDLSVNLYNTKNTLDNALENAVTVFSNQDVMIKNDIIFNNSLIDNNYTTMQQLQNKFNNLINILNQQLNLNINPNML